MGEGRRRPGDEANKERRIKLTKTLKEKERRLTAAQEALAKKQEEAGVAATQASEPADAGTTNLDKAESIIVWAHDLGVAPGEQYRYRAVAKVYNPFFTYGSLLVSDQKKLAEGFTISTPVSDWSDPYRVTPPVEFFVVDAQAGEGRLGTGQATVEVYRYVDGQRRVERFVVQPGDLIGGRVDRSGADFGTGFYLVDVFADPSIERGANERRAVSVAVVQNASGDRYEIRVPRADASDGRRRDLIDEIELAKAAVDSKEPEEAPKGGGGGAGGVGNPDSPYGPGGRG
jgi:hypothetical protein